MVVWGSSIVPWVPWKPMENFRRRFFGGQDLKPKVFNDLLQSANIEEISGVLKRFCFVLNEEDGCGLERIYKL